MIALPTFFCPKLWEKMSGTETERFCTKCRKTVYNLESLSLDRRLALLNAPSGSICGRYRIAVRRARPGMEQSYMRRLLKYGAGVAVSSTAFLTLWQLYDENQRVAQPRFRVVAPSWEGGGCGPDDNFYVEDVGITLGIFMLPAAPPTAAEFPGGVAVPLDHVDITLAPVELDKLLQEIGRPKIELPGTKEISPSLRKKKKLAM